MTKDKVITDIIGKTQLAFEGNAEIRDCVFRFGSQGQIEIHGDVSNFVNCEFISKPEKSGVITEQPMISGLSGALVFESCKIDGNGTRRLIESADGIRIRGCEIIAGRSQSLPLIRMANPTSTYGIECKECSFVACTTAGEVLVSSEGRISMRRCRFEACNVEGDLIRFNRANGCGQFEDCCFKDCAAAYHLLSSGEGLNGAGKPCDCQNCRAVDSIFSCSQDRYFVGNLIISGETTQFE